MFLLIATLLFGIAQALLALYGRISYLFYYSIVLLLCSFVFCSPSRKLLRLIPLAVCLGVCGWCIYSSAIYGDSYVYYDLIAVPNGLYGILLLVSMLPDKGKSPKK